MTPKEQAKELFEEFRELILSFLTDNMKDRNAKNCASKAVDEIIKSEPRSPSNVDWDDVGGTHQYYYEAQREEALIYWQEVKREIEKL
jgi:hypothetical protein